MADADHMETINDLVKNLGGNSKVAAILGKGQTTVSEMKRRRSIPVRYWPAIIEAASRKGMIVSESDLCRMHMNSSA